MAIISVVNSTIQNVTNITKNTTLPDLPSRDFIDEYYVPALISFLVMYSCLCLYWCCKEHDGGQLDIV